MQHHTPLNQYTYRDNFIISFQITDSYSATFKYNFNSKGHVLCSLKINAACKNHVTDVKTQNEKNIYM